MKNALKDELDIVDALENIKVQVAFLGYVNTILLETEYRPNSESKPGQEIILGMSVAFDSLRDQVDELSEALPKYLHTVTKQNISTAQKTAEFCAAVQFVPRNRSLKKAAAAAIQ